VKGEHWGDGRIQNVKCKGMLDGVVSINDIQMGKYGTPKQEEFHGLKDMNSDRYPVFDQLLRIVKLLYPEFDAQVFKTNYPDIILNSTALPPKIDFFNLQRDRAFWKLRLELLKFSATQLHEICKVLNLLENEEIKSETRLQLVTLIITYLQQSPVLAIKEE
jgi:hypothetical protein